MEELDPIKFRHLTELPNGILISSVGEFMLNGNISTVGINRIYETTVFKRDNSYKEHDFLGANTKEECLKNHEILVNKWSEE